MKKILSIITTVLLLLVIAVSCAQDVTVDTQLYGAQGSGTFMLNGKYYNTLQEAVNARLGKGAKAAGANDDVIYLTRNAKGPGAKIDNPNISVIIDFAGWTYSFTDVTATQGSTTGTFGLSITGGADVTLKGLEQIDLFDSTADLTMVYIEGSDTSLTIEDAPKMVVEPTQYVFWAANGATLTIGGETTLTGGLAATGTVEKTPLVSINDGAKADVSSMKLESAKVIPNSTENLKVSTLESSGESKIINSGSGDVTVTKSEGTVVVQNTGEGTVKVDENTIPEGQAKVIEDGEVQPTVVTVSVAMIGTDEYETLEEAIDDAKDGDTVYLLKDVEISNIEIDKSLTIEGKSTKSITQSNSSDERFFILIESATKELVVNLKNLEITSVRNSDSQSSYTVLYSRNPQFKASGTIESCTITGPSVVLCATGDIDSTSKTFYGCEVLVKDCIITSTSLCKASEKIYNAALSPQFGGKITIESGTFEGTWAIAAYTSAGRVVIHDGSFNGPILTYGNAGYEDYHTEDDPDEPFHLVEVSGSGNPEFDLSMRSIPSDLTPSFYADGFVLKDASAMSDINKITISCGTYSADPSAYVADGYVARKTGDVWTVSKADDKEVSIKSESLSKDITTSLLQAVTMLNEMGCPDDLEVTLLKDIDLKGIVWTPAGTTEHPFSGVFDGGGNTISNLSIEATGIGDTLNGQGLFGTTEGASISNLHLNNVDISSDFSDKGGVGALVGYALNGIELTNITVDADSSLHGKYAGGLIGYTNVTKNGSELRDSQFLVSNCKSEATITGTRVGGFVGRMDGSDNTVYAVSNGFAIFTDCLFAGKSTATAGTSDDYAGGFVGQKTNGNPNQIVCSFFNCSVNNATIEGERTGDFFGYSNSSYAVWNCKVDNNSIVEPDDFAAYLRGYIFSINGNLYAISVNGEKQSSNIPEFNPQNTTQLQVNGDWYSTIATLDKDKWYFVSNAYSDAIGNIIFVGDLNTIYKGSHPEVLAEGTKFQRRTYVAGYKYSETRGYIYLFDMWRIVDESVVPEGTGLGKWQDVGLNGEDGFVIGEGFYFADPTSYLAPSCSVSPSGNIWIVTSGQ